MSRRVLSDFQAELLLRLQNRTDLTATMRGFFIQDAYLVVANFFDHRELQGIGTEVLLIATDNVVPTVITDMWYPMTVKNQTDGYILRPDKRETIELMDVKPTNQPYSFHWFGGTLYFEALANTQKNIKIWYKKKPVELTGGTSPVIDQMFDPLILIEASRIGLETVGDTTAADKEIKRFDEYVLRRKLPVHSARLNAYRSGFKPRVK